MNKIDTRTIDTQKRDASADEIRRQLLPVLKDALDLVIKASDLDERGEDAIQYLEDAISEIEGARVNLSDETGWNILKSDPVNKPLVEMLTEIKARS